VVYRYIPLLDLSLQTGQYLFSLRAYSHAPASLKSTPFRLGFIEADDQFMGAKMGEPKPKPTKPFGYSHFPHDLGAASIKWVEKEVNLVWSREHKDVRPSIFLGLIYREDTSHSLNILLILGRVWRISLIKLGSRLHDFDMFETLVVYIDMMHAMICITMR